MAIYEYKCKDCQTFYLETVHGLEGIRCLDCHAGTLIRVYSFSVAAPVKPHYNAAAGKEISSTRQLREEAKRISAEQSMRLGYDADIQIHDMRDREFWGATEEGLDATYNAHDSASPNRKVIERAFS